MPKPLRYAEVYAGLQDGTVEEREHGGLYSFTPRMGRTSALVDCPFCGRAVEVFTWSLAGGGKRCACGALFGRTTSYAHRSVDPSLSSVDSAPDQAGSTGTGNQTDGGQ